MNCPYCEQEMTAGVAKFDYYDGGVDLAFIPNNVERLKGWRSWIFSQPGRICKRLSPAWGSVPEHDGHICDCGAVLFKVKNCD